MPTSVPGRDNRRSQRGFSLLEVLIVLAIIGIVAGTAGLGIRAAQDARGLHADAQRLARLFTVAQAEARKSGRPVVWEHDTHGYRFSQAPRGLLMPAALARRMAAPPANGFGAASPLRTREWSAGRQVAVRVEPPATNVFHGEWISGPLVVELHDGLDTVRLLRSGSGQYLVRP